MIALPDRFRLRFAEEVERVYRELVTYVDGKVETVRYSMLTSMLLNELQKQTRENQRQARQQADRNRELAAQVAELKANQEHQEQQRVAFEQRLATLERALAAGDGDGKLAAAFDGSGLHPGHTNARLPQNVGGMIRRLTAAGSVVLGGA